MKTKLSILVFLVLALSFNLPSQDLKAKCEDPDAGDRELLIFEAHTHIGLSFSKGQIKADDFNYYLERGVNALFFNLPVDRSGSSNLYKRLKSEVSQIKQMLKDHKKIGTAIFAEDYYTNFSNHKLSLGLAIEYFKGIFNQDPNVIKKYYDLGVRMINIEDNSRDRLFKTTKKGIRLNDFGQKIIDNMNKYGILIDITHLTDPQKLEVISYSKTRVLASHSNPDGAARSKWNVSDQVIHALKKKDGMFMISINKGDLYPDKNKIGSGVKGVIAHLDYLRGILGVNQIGIGTDLQAAGKYVPQDLQGKDSFQKIIQGLKNHGYSRDDIRKIMGGNLLKLLQSMESRRK